MAIIAGSGAGSESISQRHVPADPDPYQNVTDPQHWFSDTAIVKPKERTVKTGFLESVPQQNRL